MPFMRTRDTNKGFTLVELAVSLVVIGLLVGLGMSMVGPLMTAVKVRESKENLGGAVESVNSWAAGNNKIPDKDNFKTIVKTTVDAWGRDFIYVYSESLTPGTATKDTICGRRSTLLKLIDTNISTTPIDNIAYIVFSKGDDAESDTIFTSGTLTPASGSLSPNDKITTNAFLPTASTTSTIVTTDGSNDLVRWVTLDELRTKVGCQGAQLRIVNNELPYANKGAPYPTIPLTPDGGVKFSTTPTNTGVYEWCWSSTTPQLLTDLVFNCTSPSSSTTLARTAAPTVCVASPRSGTWERCTTLTLSSASLTGTNPPPGSYDISLFLLDSDNNSTQKIFVLTINP